MKGKKIYEYHFKVGDIIVYEGWTEDLKRREQEHQQKYPEGHIVLLDWKNRQEVENGS